jgi:glucosylceramidase
VKPGAYRVSLDGHVDSLQALAFTNPDGSLAIIAFNRGDAPVRFNLAHGHQRHGCEIPAHAIQTYLASG